jgi:hypothetical protein
VSFCFTSRHSGGLLLLLRACDGRFPFVGTCLGDFYPGR